MVAAELETKAPSLQFVLWGLVYIVLDRGVSALGSGGRSMEFRSRRLRCLSFYCFLGRLVSLYSAIGEGRGGSAVGKHLT